MNSQQQFRSDASHRTILFIALTGLIMMAQPKPVCALVFHTHQNSFITDMDNQGWWSATLPNTAPNDNYAVGRVDRNVLRNFFTFDLGSLDLTGSQIVSAALQVRRGGAEGDPTETIKLSRVSTP